MTWRPCYWLQLSLYHIPTADGRIALDQTKLDVCAVADWVSEEWRIFRFPNDDLQSPGQTTKPCSR